MWMNGKQKLLSAGLSAVVLIGAATPLSVMAVSSQTAAAPGQTAQAAGRAASPTAVQAAAAAPGQPLQTAGGAADHGNMRPQGEASSETEQQSGQEDDAAEQAQLAAQAKITEADAIAAVQAVYPGGTVTASGELDRENGVPVYELNVQPSDGGQTVERKVDARTGSILPETMESQD